MKVEVKISSSEEESWNTVWKWSWFMKDVWMPIYRQANQKEIDKLLPLLRKLRIKSVLDCSCGLGSKTTLLAKMGYEIEGSDGSTVAIKYAPQLAKEEGVNIRFFHSRWEELGEKCERTYDCVFNDYFDEIETREAMKSAAKGIYSVLNKGGKFIFYGLNPEYTKSDLKMLIEKEWEKRKNFEILPPYEKEGIRVTSLEVAEKTSEGVLEKRIFLIEEQGVMGAEIAFIMNPRIKWTFQDYVEVLREAGFRKVVVLAKNRRKPSYSAG
jgi:SAM-dependent methyltransferase